MVEELFAEKIRKAGMYNEWEMLPYLVKEQGFKWFIYGAGENGKLICDLAERMYHLKPDFFVDKGKAIQERGGGKTRIYMPEELLAMEWESCIAVISPYGYTASEQIRGDINEVLHKLEKRTKKLISFYGGHLCDYFKADWYYFIKENAASFDRTYAILADELSKQSYLDFLRIYVHGERYSGVTMPEEYKYWGIDDDRCFITALDNEVLLNLGACTGDTVYQFLKLKREFKKIIAVEGDERQYHILKRNIRILEDQFKEKIQCDNYLVDEGEYAIDRLYSHERITLINMDIEGAELSVLRSAEKVIKRERPVLSICAYHKKDDLIEIPKYIQHIVSDYVYVIRKYPSEMCAWGGRNFYIDYVQQNNELVLYAIPRERYIEP